MTVQKNSVQKPPEAAIHSLFSREIRPIRNWNEWLERWQAAATIEEMLGLLHVGFDTSFGNWSHNTKKYDRIDRLIFYFGIADGWTSRWLLEKPEDRGVEYEFGLNQSGQRDSKSPSELRRILALKAFDMLCLNFFRSELHASPTDDNYQECWESVTFTERLFPVIMNFFRAEKGRFGDKLEIRNLSGNRKISHNEEQATAFLLKCALFLWTWRENRIDSWVKEEEKTKIQEWNVVSRARIEAAKPWMIEVLSYLGELRALNGQVFELGEECLAKLEEIAMREELRQHSHPVSKDRPVATLDEACFAGSDAAWFLKCVELDTREHKRLTGILEAERAMETASRTIKELTSTEK